MVLDSAARTVIPVLAQRLLLNMRQVVYIDSPPLTSKLLFVPPVPSAANDMDSIEEATSVSETGDRSRSST